MKKILFLFALSFAFIGCKNQKAEEMPVAEIAAPEISYESFGEQFSDENVLTTLEMMEKSQNLKPGDTINVKFATTVKEVCQKKGCWMNIETGAEDAMVRFKDYAFFMPKDIAGKEIIVNAKAYMEEMSVEDQRHYAEDGGKSAEEIAAITEPKLALAFEADGVLIPTAANQ